MYFGYHDDPKNTQTGFKYHQQSLTDSESYREYKEVKAEVSKEFVETDKKAARLVESEAACRHWKLSGKLRVLVSFLQDWREKDPTAKVLVFSQTKKILDIIERLSLKFGFSHLRMDGNVTLKQRMSLIETFNSTNDHYLFLLTTRVGGLGINLTAANKVIIFDPDWNPMVDIQATDRALRIG